MLNPLARESQISRLAMRREAPGSCGSGSSTIRSETGFSVIYRLLVIPLFLFSGAFFPITNLSPPLEWLARLTPLWHGVDLTRMLVLGEVRPGAALVHVGYLVALSLVGWVLAVWRLDRRLEV